MASDGPVVSCVILRADGSQEEIKLDTSPRKRQAEDFLGGACTMLGEWSEQMVVLIARQDYEDASQSLSQHKLQPPFHAYKIHGDILLMKLGEDSTPLNYTLTEYTEFQQLEIEEWLLPSEDEEDEDGSDDGSDADFAEHLFLQLVDKFVSDHKGREPTKDELVVIEAQVQDMISDMATNNDDEDDDSGSDEEEDEDEGDGEFGSDDDDDDDDDEEE